jgi:hypothetical protein
MEKGKGDRSLFEEKNGIQYSDLEILLIVIKSSS